MQANNAPSPPKEFITTITERGQVTIPVAVQRVLGTKPKEKVAFQVTGDEVRLVPAAFTLESAYGSVQPLQKPEDFSALIRKVKEEKVPQTIEKLQKS